MSSKMGLSDSPKDGNISTARNYVPNKQESFRLFPSCPEEEIVISGTAGRYPNCDNVEEFRHHLYNGVRFQEFYFNIQYSSLTFEIVNI